MFDCKLKGEATEVKCKDGCECKEFSHRIINTHMIDLRSRNAIYNEAINAAVDAAGSEAHAAQERIKKLIKQ